MQERNSQESPSGRPKMGRPRSVTIWLMIALGFLFVLIILGNQRFATAQKHLTETELYNLIKEKKVMNITFSLGDKGVDDVLAEVKSDDPMKGVESVRLATTEQGIEDLRRLANENGVPFRLRAPSRLFDALMWLMPLLVLIGLFYFLFVRQLRVASGGNVLAFGKSRARKVGRERPKV